MKKKLELLIQLQFIDSQLQELEEAKGSLPKEVEGLQTDKDSLDSSIQELEEQVSTAKGEHRDHENTISLTTEKLKKHQDQLYDVTSNKEYDAITQEIEVEKNTISDSETRVVELMEAEENAGTFLKEKKTQLEAVLQELETKDAELSKLIKANEDLALKLAHEREKIAVRIPDRLLGQYNRIRGAKNGLAVAAIERQACGGCSSAIPPQRQYEIRQMNQIIICDFCGRMLVPGENGVAN